MLSILYEDADIAVLNKPAGIAVHPSSQNRWEKTLAAEIVARWPETKNVGEDPLRPGIVHRLDKETSGVFLVAKHQRAFEILKAQFQAHRVGKTYIALVVGSMPTAEGTISRPIGRSRKFGKFTTKIPAGKVREAVTRWRKLDEYADAAGNALTLVEIRPETGRTHQIRVHLAAIGHPIVGDALYGGKAAKRYREALGRHFLHASILECELPSGSRIKIETDLPKELAQFLSGLATVE